MDAFPSFLLHLFSTTSLCAISSPFPLIFSYLSLICNICRHLNISPVIYYHLSAFYLPFLYFLRVFVAICCHFFTSFFHLIQFRLLYLPIIFVISTISAICVISSHLPLFLLVHIASRHLVAIYFCGICHFFCRRHLLLCFIYFMIYAILFLLSFIISCDFYYSFVFRLLHFPCYFHYICSCDLSAIFITSAIS